MAMVTTLQPVLPTLVQLPVELLAELQLGLLPQGLLPDLPQRLQPPKPEELRQAKVLSQVLPLLYVLALHSILCQDLLSIETPMASMGVLCQKAQRKRRTNPALHLPPLFTQLLSTSQAVHLKVAVALPTANQKWLLRGLVQLVRL